MPHLFAVIRARGPAWAADRPLEEQQAWRAHADFMNALHRDRFIVVGGPLEGTPEVLHIVRASAPDEIAARLAADPWERMDLLRTIRILPWTLRLGSLP
jgi:uncharacterized protein YciI